MAGGLHLPCPGHTLLMMWPQTLLLTKCPGPGGSPPCRQQPSSPLTGSHERGDLAGPKPGPGLRPMGQDPAGRGGRGTSQAKADAQPPRGGPEASAGCIHTGLTQACDSGLGAPADPHRPLLSPCARHCAASSAALALGADPPRPPPSNSRPSPGSSTLVRARAGPAWYLVSEHHGRTGCWCPPSSCAAALPPR